MGKTQPTTLSLVLIGLLLLSLLGFLAPRVSAEQTVLSDNFTVDSALNINLWEPNGASGVHIFSSAQSNIVAQGGSFTMVDPNPTFTSSGMDISSVNTMFLMTTVESVNAFTAPLTLTATVSAAQGGGAPFCLWLRNEAISQMVGLQGDLNPSGPMYGLWNDVTPSWWVKLLYPSPQTNTVYQLTITVSSSGDATLSVSSNGQNLGSISGESVGTGPLRVVLGQYEIYQTNTGTGPNEAYWKTVTVTSSGPVITPNPSTPTPPPSAATSATASPSGIYLTPTPSQTAASTAASFPSTTSLATPLPSGTPSTSNPYSTATGSTVTPAADSASSSLPSSSSQSSPAVSPNKASSTSSLSFPVLSVIVAVVLSSLFAASLVVFRYRRGKKGNENGLAEPNKKGLRISLFLLALVLADISIYLSGPLFGVDLLNIASTLRVTIGTASQISAIARFVGIFVGLAMSIVSLRFNHKKLLLLGQIFVAIGILGSYFTQNFVLFVVFQSIIGLGAPIVGIMTITLVGEFLPLERRGTAIGLLSSTLFLASVFGSPITGYITTASEWRSVLLWWMFPFSIISLIISALVIPAKTIQVNPPIKMKFVNAYKQVLLNKSAIACMICTMFAFAGLQITAYVVTFYRIHFSVSVTTGSYVSLVGAALAATGSIIGGRLVNPARRKGLVKPLIASALFISGSVTMAFTFMPSLWSTLALRFSSAIFATVGSASLGALVLEQVPKYRGTMISMNSAIGVGFGAVLGLTVGGSVLNSYSNNYNYLGLILGSFFIASAAMVFLITTGPSKPQKIQQNNTNV